MTPAEAAEAAKAAQNELVWKGVLGIITTLSVVVSTLFGLVMKGKNREVTRLESKNELLERQAMDREREHKLELKQQREEYEAKLEAERREKSRAVRARERTARLAEELVSEEPIEFDDEDETTGVIDAHATAREHRVVDRIRERKAAARREQERIERLSRDYIATTPPPSVPPPKPRPRFPSRRG